MTDEPKAPEIQVPPEHEAIPMPRIDAGMVFLKLHNEIGEDVDASLVQVLNQIILEMGKLHEQIEELNRQKSPLILPS
jgi:hypothetical protein